MTRRPAPAVHWLLLRAGRVVGLHASQAEVVAAYRSRPRAEWGRLAYRDCDCDDPAAHEAAMAAREEMMNG